MILHQITPYAILGPLGPYPLEFIKLAYTPLT